MTVVARPVLAVHGGAGSVPPDAAACAQAEHELGVALLAGQRVLAGGGRALDAVEAAVAHLERCGCFNAGRGAVADRDGDVTLDGAIMDGASRAAGGVAATARVASAIAAARLVLERTPHVLLAGPAADRFALEAGAEPATPGYFLRARPGATGAAVSSAPTPGTVGAVALDRRGHLAAATATGGLAGKLPGRVGDSPLPGAGIWADERCAVSATGTGELFIRAAFAHQLACGIAYLGLEPVEAARRALADVTILGGAGGCIVLGRDGTVAAPFTTAIMYRGTITADGPPRVATF
jgi:L-asparaginase / beta-aspartyl-peptidase